MKIGLIFIHFNLSREKAFFGTISQGQSGIGRAEGRERF